MNVVIPMAGLGERFRKAGYAVPKPLIPVQGIPMYRRALTSVPWMKATQLIIVAQAEHLEAGLEEDIRANIPRDVVVVRLPAPTRGQACTVLAALRYIDNAMPLYIHNADTEVTHLRWPVGAAGVLSVQHPPDDTSRWSFVRTRGDVVVEVAEKKKVGPWASTGLYYFQHGSDFCDLAQLAIDNDSQVNGEYYVAPLFNTLVKEGRKVVVAQAEAVKHMGTPEDLDEY